MTTRRTLDAHHFFDALGQRHQPRYAFAGEHARDFDQWKRTVRPLVLDTLGKAPETVPANPELLSEWEEDGLIKQRWVLDVQPGLSATLLLFRPANLKDGEKRPAILCCHGHGAYGKDSPMGLATDPQRKANIAAHRYDYGLEMARRGFVTYAIDWLGFGERDPRRKPHHAGSLGPEDPRDPCNVFYLCATMMGTTLLAMNCHDGSRATDFVCEQPFVDGERLGVMGLSLGGTMTTWMTLTDERFKASDIICYAGPFYDIAYRTYNVCGSQLAPGLFDLVDTPELQGLIAPQPLLVEIGIHDTCFHVDHSLNEHYQRLERIYDAAGASSRLELDLFPGEHAWGGNKSETFFRQYLGADW